MHAQCVAPAMAEQYQKGRDSAVLRDWTEGIVCQKAWAWSHLNARYEAQRAVKLTEFIDTWKKEMSVLVQTECVFVMQEKEICFILFKEHFSFLSVFDQSCLIHFDICHIVQSELC